MKDVILTESSDVPKAVVNTGQATTVLRVADLGEKHGRRDLAETVAKTEKNTATHESWSRWVRQVSMKSLGEE